MHNVIIIGAGLAGLYTARLLHDSNVTCMVVEARDRIGGRILTANEAGVPDHDGFDLGPSWFWPQMQPAMAELVEELALPAFPQATEGDVLVERMSREGPQRFQAYPAEARSFRIVGGSGALVQGIADALPATDIRLGVRVTALALTNSGVEVAAEDHGAPITLHARVVVCALPPRLLAHSVQFTPAPDTVALERWHRTPTWMAPHAKFFAMYDRAFWQDAGLCGTAQSMVGPMPEIHDATTATGKPALFGFVGVSADQRAAMGERTLRDACVAQLVRLFGVEAATPRATLLKDWAADPFTATPADRMPSGHPVPDTAPWVSGAWAQHLVFGGSETSRTEPGYLAGAVTAARSAAEAVRTRLGR